MTIEEKKALNRARVSAVKQAWVAERILTSEGKCTRQWSKAEVEELNTKGHISGYAGHHMLDVSHHPQYAGDMNNIQFLTTKEHISQAHRNNTKAETHGYYNTQTHKTERFRGQPRRPIYTLNVSAKTRHHTERSNAETVSQRSNVRAAEYTRKATRKTGRNVSSSDRSSSVSYGGTSNSMKETNARQSDLHSHAPKTVAGQRNVSSTRRHGMTTSNNKQSNAASSSLSDHSVRASSQPKRSTAQNATRMTGNTACRSASTARTVSVGRSNSHSNSGSI